LIGGETIRVGRSTLMPRTVMSVSGVFVPGWGAHAGIYRGAVPGGWEILEPPSFVASGATVAAYRQWIVERCRERPAPFTLAGHSFGAVLAVHAALADGVEVDRLVLVSPSALPLVKPVPLMFWDFSRRVAAGWFRPRDAARAVRQVLFHPLLAHRLGMEVRTIDLSEELAELRDRGVPCTVLAASTDTLTPPLLCRRVAALCGGDYCELDLPGGHLWFLRAHDLLASALSAGRG
jgi:pimeloyl-ACP methyl ester carboxylesterase